MKKVIMVGLVGVLVSGCATFEALTGKDISPVVVTAAKDTNLACTILGDMPRRNWMDVACGFATVIAGQNQE